MSGPWPASPVLRPVFYGGNFFILLDTIKDSEAVHDLVPSAVHIAADFTFSSGGASTGAIEQALCAASDGTDPCCLGKNTIAAPEAFFTPSAGFIQRAEETRIKRREDGQFLKHTRKGLNTGPAG